AGIRYVGFCDPSGGSRGSFTAGVAHADGDKAVLDALREKKAPLSPDTVVEEYAALFRSYGITSIRGDRYSGEFVRELFRKRAVEYRPSDQGKSDIYLTALPAINSGLVDLLDNKHLLSQLTALERRTARGGRDSVDHPPNAHDELANAACGALIVALQKPRWEEPMEIGLPVVGGDAVQWIDDE